MLLRPASEALLRNGDAGLLPGRQGQSKEPERPVPQVIFARRGAPDPRGHAVSLVVTRGSILTCHQASYLCLQWWATQIPAPENKKAGAQVLTWALLAWWGKSLGLQAGGGYNDLQRTL